MKKTTWKKIVSFVLVAALVISVGHFGGANVQAEETLINGVKGESVEADHPAVQYTFDRQTLNYIDNSKPEIKMALLLDMSNSMSRQTNGRHRLADAKLALLGNDKEVGFIDSIYNSFDATVSVYTFNSQYSGEATAEVLKDGKSADAVKAAISGLTDANTSNGTDISAGVKTSLDNLSENDILVILSDGEATYATVYNEDGTKTVYGPSWSRPQDADEISTYTDAALNNAVAAVKKVYAINFQDAGIEGIEGIEIYNANSISTLASAFKDINESIKKIAKGAKLIAEVGKYVQFTGITGEGNVHEAYGEIVVSKDDEGKDVYTYNEKNKDKKVIIWEGISDPDERATTSMSGNSEIGIKSPIVNFKVNATAEDLIKAWNAGDTEIKVIDNEDGSVTIKLAVTATTILTYTQTVAQNEQTQTISVTVPVEYFDTFVAYESVPKNEYEVKYYKEVLTEAGKELIFDPISVTTYGDDVYEGPAEDEILAAFSRFDNTNYDGSKEVNHTENSNTWEIIFKLATSNVYFKNEDGKTDFVPAQSGKVGQTVIVPTTAPTKDADEDYTYAFEGWTLDGKVVEPATTFGTADVTYVASFTKELIPTSTVTFMNGDDLISSKEGKVGDKVVTPDDPKKVDLENKSTYTFIGWSTDKNATTAGDVAQFYTEKDVTYYAVFTNKAIESTVTFISENVPLSTLKKQVGQTVEIPADPSKEEDNKNTYEFIGWSKDGENVVVVNNKYTDTDVTYYAVFKANPKATIKFVVDEETVKTDTEKVGTKVVKPDDPSKPGNNFKGWSTDGKTVVDVAEEFGKDDITYIAVFEEIIPDPVVVPETPVVVPETPVIPVIDPYIPIQIDPVVPEPEPVVVPEPEPVVEEVEIEPVIETPEGAPEEEEEIEEIEEVEEEEEVEIEPVIETPEGAPEEELDLDDVETPEGLPQTGTAPIAVFFGIGAACIILGGTMIIKVRRREEEM